MKMSLCAFAVFFCTGMLIADEIKIGDTPHTVIKSEKTLKESDFRLLESDIKYVEVLLGKYDNPISFQVLKVVNREKDSIGSASFWTGSYRIGAIDYQLEAFSNVEQRRFYLLLVRMVELKSNYKCSTIRFGLVHYFKTENGYNQELFANKSLLNKDYLNQDISIDKLSSDASYRKIAAVHSWFVFYYLHKIKKLSLEQLAEIKFEYLPDIEVVIKKVEDYVNENKESQVKVNEDDKSVIIWICLVPIFILLVLFLILIFKNNSKTGGSESGSNFGGGFSGFSSGGGGGGSGR